MATSTEDPVRSSRSRRRTSRVNYAEDTSFDEIQSTSTLPSISSSSSTSKVESKDVKGANESSVKQKVTSASTDSAHSHSSDESSATNTSKNGTKSLSKSSKATKLSSTSTKRDKDTEEVNKIQNNWQREFSASEIASPAINLKNSYIGDDLCLHLEDGTVYCPEGKSLYFFFVCNITIFLKS